MVNCTITASGGSASASFFDGSGGGSFVVSYCIVENMRFTNASMFY
jgi:hypothetical protein